MIVTDYREGIRDGIEACIKRVKTQRDYSDNSAVYNAALEDVLLLLQIDLERAQ